MTKFLKKITAFLPKDPVFKYLCTLGFLFAILYSISYAWAGLTTPANYYSPFITKYLNYIDWIRSSLLHASKFVGSIFGFDTYIEGTAVRVVNGLGVDIDYPCIGYGIYSFWLAFILSYPSSLKKRITWLFMGFFIIWLCNVIRISFLLILVNKDKNIDVYKFGDHHDIYNLAVYSVIILMILQYTREKKSPKPIAVPQNPSQ